MGAVARVQQVVQPVQRQAPVVKILDGIAFANEIDNSGMNMEWCDDWKSLESVLLQNGGMMHKGRYELFRILSTRILDAVIDLNDRNICLRTLSPRTIYLDDTGLAVRLLVLPTFSELDDPTSDLNAASNEIYSSYVSSSTDSAVLQACINNGGLHFDVHDSSNADVWSFGMTLFLLCFGVDTLKVSGPTVSVDKSVEELYDMGLNPLNEISAELLHRLLQPIIHSQSRGNDTADDLAITMQSLLDEKARGLLYTLVEETSDVALRRLDHFRESFIAESPTCGLTEQSAGILFERMVQNLYCAIVIGSESVSSLRNRVSSCPHDMTPQVAKDFAQSVLGLQCTKAEFEALVAAMSGEIRKRPYAERATKAFKAIAGLLEEVFNYGSFQQALYIISCCLNPDVKARPKLTEIRRLPLFASSNDVSMSKASREALLLLTPFQNSKEFYEKALMKPLRDCTMALLIGMEDAVAREQVEREMELEGTIDTSLPPAPTLHPSSRPFPRS